MTIIRGSGGGKGGGGGGRVAVESPDSLRSKQYARVLDAISEGEIGGLVNGLRSIYLNGTPLQNTNGSFNFSDVVVDSRNGTQGQSYLRGFPSVENEVGVSTEVTTATPIIRTISNANIDSARVTISVPALTFQDTTTGDISGTSVQFAIDVQSNGGGFVPQILARKTVNMGSGTSLSTGSNTTSAASLQITWTGTMPNSSKFYLPQSYAYRIEGSLNGGAYSTLYSGSFSGRGNRVEDQWERVSYIAPTGIANINLNFASGAWVFRIIKVSGSGSAVIGGTYSTGTSTLTISGKTTSTYQRAYNVPLSGSAPWDIRVRRITPDSTKVNLRNAIYFSSYTEVVASKLKYPNTALVGISINAEQFDNIPARGYEIYGMLVKIPSNYNPDTREYTGIWDGTFDIAWSDNPAWCFYDLVTNDRYGLGAFISEDQVDKWALYQIAQYCDELIDDGFGGVEPRFTCNLYLQTREEAYSVLQNMASIFRGLVYWAGGTVVPVHDAPSNPVASFVPANVQGGVFNYSGASVKARHTVALVSWNDPADQYKQKIEYVEDTDGIEQLGVIQTEVVAMGCTSRGQAHRLGRAILYSERMETETISFRCGLDSVSVMPGEIIQTSDPVRAGARMGGRIVTATTTDITLDQDVTIEAGKTYTLWCVLPDGTLENQTVTNGTGATNILTVAGFSSAPQNNAIWVLGSNDLIPESWRVISISEADGIYADVTALSYRPDKYPAIESGIVLEPLPTSILNPNQQDAPTNVNISESLYLVSPVVVGARITVSWSGTAPFYELSYRITDGNWQFITTQSNSVDIQPAQAGDYEFSLVAINAIGVRSSTVSATATIYGLKTPPADVNNLSLSANGGTALISFDPSADLDVIVGGYLRIRHSPNLVNPDWNNSVDIGQQVPGSSTNTALPLLAGSYLAKWVDSSGNESESAQFISTNAPSLISLNFVADLEQSTAFNGVKVNTAVANGGLTLDSALTIGEMTSLISTWPRISALGGISPIGEYYFDQNIDLGSIQVARLTGSLTSVGIDALDLIGERGLVSSWPSVVGDLISDVGCQIFIRTTDDDPDTSSAAWSDWAAFVVGEYQSRGFEFKAVLTSQYETHNIVVSQLSVVVDMPDRIDSGDDIVSGAGPLTQAFNLQFMIPPALGITAQDMDTGDYYEITNKTMDSFDIIFYNSGGTPVSRTFDYIARAY